MGKASVLILAFALAQSTVQGFQAVPNVQGMMSQLQSSVMDEIDTQSSLSDNVTRDLPPLLQTLADERREYELNLGKAMDTLRKDYPHMLYQTPGAFYRRLYVFLVLTEKSIRFFLSIKISSFFITSFLDFSIYNENINVLDPSGVQLTGLKNYKHSFTFLQTLVRFFYNTDVSTVQSRMIYDFARSSIRISWNAVLVPKVVGNRRNALYVDGVSVYKMDVNGKILEHKVEKMVMNGTPVVPPYGVFSALKEELLQGQRIPVGVGVGVGAMFKQ